VDLTAAETRLEAAIQSTDHELVRYEEKPYTLSDNEWLKLIAAHARELVGAASDYLDSDQVRQQPAHT
jgi:hypothetical protein